MEVWYESKTRIIIGPSSVTSTTQLPITNVSQKAYCHTITVTERPDSLDVHDPDGWKKNKYVGVWGWVWWKCLYRQRNIKLWHLHENRWNERSCQVSKTTQKNKGPIIWGVRILILEKWNECKCVSVCVHACRVLCMYEDPGSVPKTHVVAHNSL